MLEYCTATTDELSRMDCIDTLGGVREDIKGVSAILTLMADNIMQVEPKRATGVPGHTRHFG